MKKNIKNSVKDINNDILNFAKLRSEKMLKKAIENNNNHDIIYFALKNNMIKERISKK